MLLLLLADGSIAVALLYSPQTVPACIHALTLPPRYTTRKSAFRTTGNLALIAPFFLRPALASRTSAPVSHLDAQSR
jgi:hypothetical protein